MPEKQQLATQGDRAEEGRSLADFARFGAAGIGVFYVLGFTVVTIHLGRYHVAPFGLLRVQYLLAGLWLLMPLLCIVLSLLWAAAIYRMGIRGDSPVRRGPLLAQYIIRIVLSPLLAVGYVWVMALFLFFVAPELPREWGSLDTSFVVRYAGIVLLYAIALALMLAKAWRHWRDIRSSDQVIAMQKVLLLIMIASFALATFVGYTVHFALNAYPRLPAVLGGDSPESVVLMVQAEPVSAPPLQTVVSALRDSSQCELLLETDKTYVLRTIKTARVVVINKDKLYGISFVRASATY